MPSPLDLLEGRGPFDPASATPTDDILRSIRADGARRRTRRRRRNLGLAVLCLALLALPAAALRPAGHRADQKVDVAADGGGSVPVALGDDPTLPPMIDPVPTTATAAEVPPTLPPAVAPASSASPPLVVTPVVPPPTRVTAPTRTATTATTAALACRNSGKPACGGFRWDPPPAPNQPLVGRFIQPPATAKVGEAVDFAVEWSDPDATLTYDQLTTDGTGLASVCSMAPRFGPWTPPAAVPGSGTLRYTRTFPVPGTYRVAAYLGSASCASPYGDDTHVETTVTVS